MMDETRRISLVRAYLATDYLVQGFGQPIRIHQLHAGLDLLLLQNKVTSWAFLTACNPMSSQRADWENNIRNQALHAELSDFVVFSGAGKDPSGIWPAEPSFLILGIDLASAKHLAGRFEQMAFLFGELAKPAMLFVHEGSGAYEAHG